MVRWSPSKNTQSYDLDYLSLRSRRKRENCRPVGALTLPERREERDMGKRWNDEEEKTERR